MSTSSVRDSPCLQTTITLDDCFCCCCYCCLFFGCFFKRVWHTVSCEIRISRHLKNVCLIYKGDLSAYDCYEYTLPRQICPEKIARSTPFRTRYIQQTAETTLHSTRHIQWRFLIFTIPQQTGQCRVLRVHLTKHAVWRMLRLHCTQPENDAQRRLQTVHCTQPDMPIEDC